MAATQFRQDINLLGVGQLTNVRIHNVTTSELATLATQLTLDNTGMIVFNVDDDTSYVWEGASFVANSGGSVTAPVTSVAGKIGAVVLTNTDVGLANVDDTSDVDKPVSTAQQVAIDAKEDKIVKSIGYATWDGTNWVFVSSPSGGATIDDTAASTSTVYSSSKVDSLVSSKQDTLVSGTNIKTIGGTSLLGSGSVNLTKSDVGLSNVDNTSDANKPISTATATALSGKQDTLVSGTNIKTIGSTSLLGSGSVNLSKSDVGLSNVDNTSDANKPISTATATALSGKEATITKSTGYLTWNGSTWVFKNDVYAAINDSLSTSSTSTWSIDKISSQIATRGDVTLNGNQTLTNKTIVSGILSSGYTETVYSVSPGAGFILDPTNGSIQNITLVTNTTVSVGTGFSSGQSVTLLVRTTSSSITWPVGITWIGGSAPIMDHTRDNIFCIWKVDSVMYGLSVGKA